MPLPRGYAELAPPPSLAGIITCVWTRTQDVQRDRTVPRIPVLPDACTDLIWVSGVGAVVAGPDTVANRTDFGQSHTFVGIRFAPGHGGAAFGASLVELRNSRLSAPDAWSVRSRRARSRDVKMAFDAVHGSESPGDAMAAVLRFASAVAADVSTHSLAAHAASRIRHPEVSVRSLAAELEISDRRLHRMFEANVGYGAKTVQRIDRFQRFLSELTRSESLADAAARAGYADQPHLSRECIALSGMTPSALRAARSGTPA